MTPFDRTSGWGVTAPAACWWPWRGSWWPRGPGPRPPRARRAPPSPPPPTGAPPRAVCPHPGRTGPGHPAPSRTALRWRRSPEHYSDITNNSPSVSSSVSLPPAIFFLWHSTQNMNPCSAFSVSPFAWNICAIFKDISTTALLSFASPPLEQQISCKHVSFIPSSVRTWAASGGRWWRGALPGRAASGPWRGWPWGCRCGWRPPPARTPAPAAAPRAAACPRAPGPLSALTRRHYRSSREE